MYIALSSPETEQSLLVSRCATPWVTCLQYHSQHIVVSSNTALMGAFEAQLKKAMALDNESKGKERSVEVDWGMRQRRLAHSQDQ